MRRRMPRPMRRPTARRRTRRRTAPSSHPSSSTPRARWPRLPRGRRSARLIEWFKAVPPTAYDDGLLTTGDRVRRRGPTSADPIDGRLGLVSKGGDDDREDQEQPEGDALDLDRHAARAAARSASRPRSRTASTTPGIVPEPPKMLTPPSRTTVTTVRVMPWPGVGAGAREARGEDHPGERGDEAGQHEQADPQPLRRGRPSSGRRPCSCRSAKTWRPIHVRWRTMPRMMARPRKIDERPRDERARARGRSRASVNSGGKLLIAAAARGRSARGRGTARASRG